MLRKIIQTALMLTMALFAHADEKSLDKMVFNAAVVNSIFPQERVYLHFDNSAYYLGETMWFKAYVTEGVKDAPSTLSKVLYVELCAPEGYVVETKKYKLDDKGCCHGEFELKPLLLSGYYEVRAYTRYMLNWGKDAVFSRVLPIFDKVNGNNWEHKIMLDRRRGFMYRGNWVSSDLPEIDLKFYPEGGHLVEGIESTVAYELRGEDGIAVEGTVYIYADKKLLQKRVPTHAGKGTFTILPQGNVKYHATVKRGKKEHEFEFPAIEKEGVVIAVSDEQQKVSIKVSNNLEASTDLGCAILHRGELSHYQSYDSENDGKIFTIDKDSLREGVNRVIVFVNDNLPLAERQFFVMHEKIQPGDRETAKLKITANGKPLHKLSLNPHEKFSVTIEREDGKPIDENTELSLSVSDAAGRQQTSYTHNMYSYLLLGSELKGYIPDAARYFDLANKNRAKELDLLMLTNGWTSYDWSKLAKKDIKLDQPMEKGITVKGTFYKKDRGNNFGNLGRFTLIPQRDLEMKFEICYKDSTVSNYEFASDSKGSFQLQTEDFYGKRIAALTPNLSAEQIVDTIYSYSLDRYFTPGFRLYDYWERHTGMPLTDKEKMQLEGKAIKLRPFEYMLTSVEVTAAKEKEQYSRPPHSEMRFDYLDEWEYAQDVTYLHVSKDYDKHSYDAVEQQQERLNQANNEEDYITILNNEIAFSGISSVRGPAVKKFQTPYVKYLGNTRYWHPAAIESATNFGKELSQGTGGLSDDPNYMRIPSQNFPNAYTAADVVRSAMKRHNYNWAYWVQLMVVDGEYNSESAPRPDNEYIKGRDAIKMTNFKEFVIRSDKATREQFLNYQSVWTRKSTSMDYKMHYIRFYMGFFSQLYVTCKDGVDGFEGRNFHHKVKSGINLGRSFPINPNYVACMIPYKEGEDRKGIVPILHTGGNKRYTSVQGYNDSKQFYSPDYNGVQPAEKDFRRTLIWVPSVKSIDGKATIELCNSSVAQHINVSAEGHDNGTIYGSDPNILTRTLSHEQRREATKECESATMLKNPALMAECLKIAGEGLKLYKEKVYDKAFEKFYDAAMLGYPTAMFYAGVCYHNGEGTEQDSVMAFRMFRNAANAGEITSMHNLANCYANGYGTARNDSLAVRWYRSAADSGYAKSMTMLAKCYEEGVLIEKDNEKSHAWYSRAAENKEPYALYKLGCHQERMDSLAGLKKRATRKSPAVEYFTLAATLKSPQAQMKIAECHSTGRYFKKSKSKRFEWLLHAANNGLVEAQEQVAECYEKGRGTAKNDVKAYHWYKRAAEQGSDISKSKVDLYKILRFYP